MKNSFLIALIIAVVAGIALLFVMQFSSYFDTGHQRFTYSDIRGAAVYYKDKPYTLNFDQEAELLEAVNRTVPIVSASFEFPGKSTLPLSKIAIYLFNGNTIELFPRYDAGEEIIFEAPALAQGTFLKDTSGGSLRTMLLGTFDKS